MPIHVPGVRDRRGRRGGTKRSAVATLQLVAMVDLFTVMVVFLLQNYNTTGEILEIPQNVILPQAKEVKLLKPANVVIVSDSDVIFNGETIMTFNQIKSQQDWMIDPLFQQVTAAIENGEKEKQALGQRLRAAVERVQTGEKESEEVDGFRKVTVQADEKTDFLTLKKVMYTITEAGIVEINFAVIPRPGEDI